MPTANSIAIPANSVVVTGTLTAFDAREGDTLYVNGLAIPIQSGDSTTQVTLRFPASTSAITDATRWSIERTGPYWQSTITTNSLVTDLIRRIDGGLPLQADGTGTLADRAAYDDAARGFRFLRADTSPLLFYLKLSAAHADWSAGISLQTGPTGPGFAATSTSSVAIGTGSKTFGTQPGLAYVPGARARVISATDSTKWMEGPVTAYGGSSLTIGVDLVSGSGTLAAWAINLAGERGATGSTGSSGAAGTNGSNGAGATGQCKLVWASTTSVRLDRHDGSYLTINGTPRQISSGGGPTLANTGLTAGTPYYVYAYWTGSAVALEADTTGHAVDAGSGAEIKIGDATRTLVGLVCPNGSGQFEDSASYRGVRSWFSDHGVSLHGASISASSGSTSPVSLGGNISVLCWGDEALLAVAALQATNDTAGQADYLALALDSVSDVGPQVGAAAIVASAAVALSSAYAGKPSAGLHILVPYGFVSGGTGSWSSGGLSALQGVTVR